MKKTILSFIFVIISMAGFSQSLYEYTDLSNYRVKVGELVLNGQKMRPITPLVNQVLMYDGLRWKNQNEKDLIFAADSANIVKYVGNDRDLEMGANSISTDTVKINGVPLLLNTFKKDSLGGAGNIFYSTGASSQPASGSVNQVVGGGLLSANAVVKWDGSKFANSGIIDDGGNVGIGTNPFSSLTVKQGTGIGFEQTTTTHQDTRRWWMQNDTYIYGDFAIRTSSIKDAASPNNYRFYINNLGNISINKTDPSERLDVNGNAIADILKSRVPTGTAPLVVASTTKVDSLNVGLLDGKKASDFQLKSDTLTFDATISDLNDSTAAIRALANTKATISGTDNFIMKKTGENTLGNSSISDNGTFVSTALPFSSSYSLSAPTHFAGTSFFNATSIELGTGRTGNNLAYIDFTGDQTYTDYGLRIFRANSGADAFSALFHRGKGDLLISAQDAGRVILGTKNTSALIIDTLQNVGIGMATPTYKLDIDGGAADATLNLSRSFNPITDGTIGRIRTTNNYNGDWMNFALRVNGGNRQFVQNAYDAATGTYTDLLIYDFTTRKVLMGTNATDYSFINSGNVGFGTTTPAARIHSQSTTTPQLILGYDATNKTTFTTGSTGNLTIDPTGDKLSIAEKTGINKIGGVMVKLTNKTGASSVKGTVVYVNPSVDNAFGVNPIDGDMPFGVVFESGIADGSECWVVVDGIAEILIVDGQAATRSYIAYSSSSVAGRVDTAASVPAADDVHFREIGHTLESKAGGTDILCKCVIHFN